MHQTIDLIGVFLFLTSYQNLTKSHTKTSFDIGVLHVNTKTLPTPPSPKGRGGGWGEGGSGIARIATRPLPARFRFWYGFGIWAVNRVGIWEGIGELRLQALMSVW